MPRPRRRRTKEEREEGKFVDQMMYLLTAPYMFYPPWDSVWEASGNKEEAKLLRLGQAKEILEKEMCTEFEAMLYISSATLSHPMSHDWYVVYGWLFKRCKPEHDIFDEHEIPEQLNKYPQQEDLDRLRRWIYRSQMNHLKTRLDTDQAAVEAEGQELLEEQQRLF